MGYNKPLNKFVDYFSKPMQLEQVNYLNNLNNIVTDKVDLFHDFTVSLLITIYETYMGDEFLNTPEEKTKHFNWCFNKTIENFNKENFFFKENGEHYYYFLNYFQDIFYSSENKTEELINKIKCFWDNILSLDKPKTKSEYDIFIELYKILNKYLFIPY